MKVDEDEPLSRRRGVGTSAGARVERRAEGVDVRERLGRFDADARARRASRDRRSARLAQHCELRDDELGNLAVGSDRLDPRFAFVPARAVVVEAVAGDPYVPPTAGDDQRFHRGGGGDGEREPRAVPRRRGIAVEDGARACRKIPSRDYRSRAGDLRAPRHQAVGRTAKGLRPAPVKGLGRAYAASRQRAPSRGTKATRRARRQEYTRSSPSIVVKRALRLISAFALTACATYSPSMPPPSFFERRATSAYGAPASSRARRTNSPRPWMVGQ